MSPSAVPLDDTAKALRAERAMALVMTYLPWAGAAGALPYPGFNVTAVAAVQLRMLAKLAEHYGVPFEQTAAKSIIAALLATVAEGTLASGMRTLSFFLVPVVGTVVSMFALPTMASTGTVALGKLFITHFEAGGTFLDFDPKRVEAHFRRECAQR